MRANDEFLKDCDFDPIGVPVRESFPDNAECQDMMDRVYATGQWAIWRTEHAVCLIEPARSEGRLTGVYTAWVWLLQSPRQAAEAPREATSGTEGAFRRVVLLTVIGLSVAWIVFAFVTIALSSNASGFASDMRLYQEAAQRWMAGGAFYHPYQVAGPYVVPSGPSPLPSPVMYPPAALAFLVPASFLPAVLWYAIPLGVTAWIVAGWRPSMAGWAGIAVCAAFVPSIWTVVAGNPSMWVLMAVALSTRWRWVGAFVLLKPSVFPFALPGIRDPGWWAVVVGMAVVTLALWPLTLDWIAVVRNATGERSGLLYSLREVPLLMIPWIARLGRSSPARG